MSVEVMKNLHDSFIENYEAFNKGNKSAGTRARKALSEIAKVSKQLRVEIQQKKNESK